MDRSSFERLAVDQLDAVFRLALRLVGNRELAEDLVQDTYSRALRSSAVASFDPARSSSSGDPGFSPEAAMRSWLYTICHNLYYSQVRRNSKAPKAVAEFYDEPSRETPPEESPPAWDRSSLDWEQVDASLKSAIEGLREEYREVLLMWGADGLKYREIAAILGVPIGTVMSRLHRARKLVADALGDAAGELGVRGGDVRGWQEARSIDE